MTEFVNRLTGGRMWVADERVEEYKAAGHKLAASSMAKPTEDVATSQQKKQVAKKTARK